MSRFPNFKLDVFDFMHVYPEMNPVSITEIAEKIVKKYKEEQMRTVDQIMKETDTMRKLYEAEMIRLNEELMKARAAEEAEKNKPWVPKYGEEYWYVTGAGEATKSENTCSYDKKCAARRNCFHTLEEAEADEEKRTVTNLLRDAATKAGRKNGEFAARGDNWFFLINFVKNSFFAECTSFYAQLSVVYFPSKESLLSAISEIGEDRIKRVLFGVAE